MKHIRCRIRLLRDIYDIPQGSYETYALSHKALMRHNYTTSHKARMRHIRCPTKLCFPCFSNIFVFFALVSDGRHFVILQNAKKCCCLFGHFVKENPKNIYFKGFCEFCKIEFFHLFYSGFLKRPNLQHALKTMSQSHQSHPRHRICRIRALCDIVYVA